MSYYKLKAAFLEQWSVLVLCFVCLLLLIALSIPSTWYETIVKHSESLHVLGVFRTLPFFIKYLFSMLVYMHCSFVSLLSRFLISQNFYLIYHFHIFKGPQVHPIFQLYQRSLHLCQIIITTWTTESKQYILKILNESPQCDINKFPCYLA